MHKFCRNYNEYGRSQVWRELKMGLVYTLLMPDRSTTELAIDFMTDLLAKSTKSPGYLIVIVDRLKGNVAIEEMYTM